MGPALLREPVEATEPSCSWTEEKKAWKMLWLDLSQRETFSPIGVEDNSAC